MLNLGDKVKYVESSRFTNYAPDDRKSIGLIIEYHDGFYRVRWKDSMVKMRECDNAWYLPMELTLVPLPEVVYIKDSLYI